MRQLMTCTAALAVAGSLIVAVAPATAQVARPQAALLTAPADDAITPVRWRGGWGVGAGFAAGALLGAGIAGAYGPYYYGPAYYGPPVVYGPPAAYGPPPDGDAVAYCMQRFKSYDPGSGTYLGYDGLRHPCP